MMIDIWTRSLMHDRKARMKASHQDDAAVIAMIDVDGNKIAIYGPSSAKEAFTKMVEIFNEAMGNA